MSNSHIKDVMNYRVVFEQVRSNKMTSFIFINFHHIVSEDAKSPPTNIVVIRNGNMYNFDLYQYGELLTPPAILQRLEDIMKRSEEKSGLGLGALNIIAT